MARFNRQKFISFILENKVVGFFDEPITLKSGRKSNWYVNWRTVTSDVFLTDKLADFLISFAQELGLKYDGFFGVPEGATKIAIISSYKWAKSREGFSAGSHRLSMGRGKPKEHGAAKDKYFLGEPHENVVVVEDVTTTGGSLLATIDYLKQAGSNVVAAIGLTNRMELDDNRRSVADAVAAKGVKYYAMSEAADILPEAVKRFNAKAEVVKAIEKEFAEFGVKPLRLR
jgi:orotate phosphoribosyltransferase